MHGHNYELEWYKLTRRQLAPNQTLKNI